MNLLSVIFGLCLFILLVLVLILWFMWDILVELKYMSKDIDQINQKIF
jgi:hypothetical protein